MTGWAAHPDGRPHVKRDAFRRPGRSFGLLGSMAGKDVGSNKIAAGETPSAPCSFKPRKASALPKKKSRHSDLNKVFGGLSRLRDRGATEALVAV